MEVAEMTENIVTDLPYKIKDISLADSGRKAMGNCRKGNARINGHPREIWIAKTIGREKSDRVITYDGRNCCIN